MSKALYSHCWHWGKYDYDQKIDYEQCCNCDKYIKREDRWNGTDNGKCEWED